LGRPKLEKFAALANMSNVYERDAAHKGQWASAHFKNDHPIVLELACGKGDYAIGLAKQFPEKNFTYLSVGKTIIQRYSSRSA
jgi:tRNA (guanine-N7-)-methyltransferase